MVLYTSTHSRRRFVVALFAMCILALVAAGIVYTGSSGPFATEERTLVVADAASGERLIEVSVTDGEEVTLAYTHSVEKTPVEDIYLVDGTDLYMDRMVFNSFGAGLPSEAEVERTPDGLVATIDRTYEEIVVVPGSIAGHELIVGDERYDLVERSEGAVVLFVETDVPGAQSSAETVRPQSTTQTLSWDRP